MDTPQTGPVQATDRAPFVPKAYVTFSILGVTVVMFLAQLVPGWELAGRLGFVPALAVEQPWRVVTVALVHDQPSPVHLLSNMIGLWFFGSFVERSLGHVRFAVIYVLGTVGGSTMVLLLADALGDEWVTTNIGASGAVFAIVGVLLTPTKSLDRNISGVVLFVLLNFGYSFLVQGVSWQAHLGGLLTGFILGCAALLVSKKKSVWVFAVVALGLLLAMLAADSWKLMAANAVGAYV